MPSRISRGAEDEVELRGGLVRWHQPHPAASTSIRTRAARDRQCRSTGVEERTLDRDRTPLEDVDPSAFPAHTDLDPDAFPLIGADNVGVRLVEELIVEREQVAGGITVGREIHDRVRGRVLDNTIRLRPGRAADTETIETTSATAAIEIAAADTLNLPLISSPPSTRRASSSVGEPAANRPGGRSLIGRKRRRAWSPEAYTLLATGTPSP